MSLKTVLGAIRGVGATLLPPPSAQAVATSAQTVDPFEDPRWAMVRDKPPEEWDLDAMYAAAGTRPSDRPFVAIAAPFYRESAHVARVCMQSRNVVRLDLKAHDINSGFLPLSGDSLIIRMRQLAVHLFLMSGATHLLFWDGDIECTTPDCVRMMLATGHDVIAGACPFKDDSGRTVHNMWDDEPPVLDEQRCCVVRDAGTGFLMISRAAILRMLQAYPELLHWSMSFGPHRGVPLWGLFNTPIVGKVLQSEDYYFCHLWQEIGGEVHVYAPARFRHWGEHGFEASFEEQYGLVPEAEP
jgi:hypothetical protein